MKNPKEIEYKNHGAVLPMYEVTNEGIVDLQPITLHFCKGNTKDDSRPRQVGVFTESIVMAAIEHLKSVNVGELADVRTAQAIAYFEVGLICISQRAQERKERNVQGTYEK